MRKVLKLGGVILAGVLLLSGCRGATVYNVENSPIEAKVPSSKIYDAIKIAGASKGWIITNVRPGLALGKLNARNHIAIVEISYTQNSYSIKYKDSTELNYNASNNEIHQNYNGWIKNLENAINLQLSMLQN